MLVDKVHPMDNCELFLQLRARILAFGKNTRYDDMSLLYYSGNEQRIGRICIKIIEILKEHELLAEKSHPTDPTQMLYFPIGRQAMNHLRGVFLFFVVNSVTERRDAACKWSITCSHLVEQLPLMPRMLAVTLSQRCGMESMLLELISCAPRWLADQYFGSLSDSLAHIYPSPMDVQPLMWLCLRAAYNAIVYRNIREANENLCRMVARMLQRHLMDTPQILAAYTPMRRKGYLAVAMFELLSVTLLTLDEQALLRPVPQHFRYYEDLCEDVGEIDPDPRPSLRKLAKILMDALQRIVLLVSVDVFMHWVELKSPRPLYNYQELICLKSAQLLAIMQLPENAELAKHSVCKQVKTFAEGAKDFEKRLAELNIGDLLNYLDSSVNESPEKRLAALNELFSRPITFGNDECVETIVYHLELLTVKHGVTILKYLGEVVRARQALKEEQSAKKDSKNDAKNGGDDKDKNKENKDENGSDESDDNAEEYSSLLQHILRPIFVACSREEKLQLLELRDKLGISEAISFATAKCAMNRNTFFNRLEVDGEFPIDQFLILCFEMPSLTWLELGRLAMAHKKFGEIFWRVGCSCANHAINYVGFVVEKLFKDKQYLRKPNSRFLVSMYGSTLILNGLTYDQETGKYDLPLKDNKLPYTKSTLREALKRYFDAFAGGLAKCARGGDRDDLLTRWMVSLFEPICRFERNVQALGRKQVKQLKREGDGAALEVAERYVDIHSHMPQWRRMNWRIVSEMMFAMDELRGDLANFDRERVRLLGTLVKYWRESVHIELVMNPGKSHPTRLVFFFICLHCLLFAELSERVSELAKTLSHPDLIANNVWNSMTLIHPREIVGLLIQACGQEADLLFRRSLQLQNDVAVWRELSRQTGRVNTAHAYEAFNYLFRHYVTALCSMLKRGQGRGRYDEMMDIVKESPEAVREKTKQLMKK
ncbi:hypothetical protein KR018_000102, partial [Drosophila ironensis]